MYGQKLSGLKDDMLDLLAKLAKFQTDYPQMTEAEVKDAYFACMPPGKTFLTPESQDELISCAKKNLDALAQQKENSGQTVTPPVASDNTMLYVGIGAAVLILLIIMN